MLVMNWTTETPSWIMDNFPGNISASPLFLFNVIHDNIEYGVLEDSAHMICSDEKKYKKEKHLIKSFGSKMTANPLQCV